MTRGVLIVFAKAPRTGLVKTRMNPPFSLEDCAALYRAMLQDVLDASLGFARELALEPILAHFPVDAAHELLPLAPKGYRLQPQHGEDLGERMAFAVREAAAGGAERILIRGSDSPALSGDPIHEALGRLDRGDDVVFTPDQGGGYALIGLRAPQPALFEVPLSQPAVLGQTLEIAKQSGLTTSLTEAAFDLDSVGDLQLLDSVADEARETLCPRTFEFLDARPAEPVLYQSRHDVL